MKWYEGPIPEAIQVSKQRKVVFIVYVHGQDDLSHNMNKVWDEDAVSSLCETEGCIAIRIAANSEECGFFSQIYPVVVVPSTYFIGVDGVPIEVTAGFVEGEAFTEKIQSVIQTHKQKTGTAQKSVNESPQQAMDFSQTTTDTGQRADKSVTDTAVTASVASETPVPGPSTENPESSTVKGDNSDVAMDAEDSPDPNNPAWLKERQDRVRKLMEEKRIEKQKKDAEMKKQKEAERRQLGQDMQKLREHQKEREIMETQKQLKKDKEEDRKAKERIREQIAKDREERAAKYRKEKHEQEELIEEKKKAKLMAQQQAAAEAEAKRSETARIQVRLPDGSSITNTFPSTDTLQALYSFVSQHLGCDVTLSTTFPKRTFTEEDLSQTFMSLQLAPSAVIIALPARRSVVSSRGDSSGGIISLILSPFLLIWRLLCSLFFGSGSSDSSTSGAGSASSSSFTSQPQSSSSGQPTEFTRRTDRPKTAYQRRTPSGNTRRLADMRDDDDDMATWNGNSTQQL